MPQKVYGFAIDSTRARVLMIIIEKMIATYQNSHRGNLDEEIFKLFEKAKTVSHAKDYESLTEAINNVWESDMKIDEPKTLASLEPRGRWYLAFTWLNNLEPRGGTIEYEEILLKATTESEALAEARAKAASGKKVKTSCGNMLVPERYRVIYKISF